MRAKRVQARSLCMLLLSARGMAWQISPIPSLSRTLLPRLPCLSGSTQRIAPLSMAAGKQGGGGKVPQPHFICVAPTFLSGIPCLYAPLTVSSTAALTTTIVWQPLSLDKILQSQGFGSRKECKNLIQNGLVSVKGEMIDDPKLKSVPEELMPFSVDGEDFEYRSAIHVVLNKPAGYECSQKPSANPSVLELLPELYWVRWHPPKRRSLSAAPAA